MTAQTKTIWQKVKLGDIASILPGFAFKSSEFKKDGDIPVIKIKNITDDLNVSIENGEYLDKSALNEKTKKYLVSNGDILVAMTGATAGKVGKFRSNGEALLNQRVAKISPKNIDANFLWILLGNKDTINLLYRLADGAAQPNMSGGQIENIEFRIPVRAEDQKQIADVLSVYDDLIENNSRRIKLFEQMAQAIYTEWFVRKNDFLPEGWKVFTVGSILDIKSGYTFKSKSYISNGLYKIVTIKNIHDGTFVSDFNCIPEIPKNMPDHCRLGDGDILLSLTGNVGRVCIAYGENLLLNQRVGKVVPKDFVYRSFIYSLFRSENFKKQLELLSNGVAQQNLSSVQTLNLKLVLPPISLITEYESLVGKLITLTINLNKQNEKLRKLRDLFLPKLVDGEIRI